MGSEIIIPECSACGLPAVYKCLSTENDCYCTKHRRECCYLMPFMQPKPKYSWEGKIN